MLAIGFSMFLMVVSLIYASALAMAWVSIASAAEVPRDAVRYQRDLTRAAHTAWGLDAPVATFAAQIHQESLWRPNAVSPVGAQGMAQFMPSTTIWISGAYPALANAQPTNPTWALRALVTYDRHLWDRVAAVDDCHRMAMTLASYNGGLGWINKEKRLAVAAGVNPGQWFDGVERFNGGRSAASIAENRAYPRRILLQHESIYEAAGWGVGSCP